MLLGTLAASVDVPTELVAASEVSVVAVLFAGFDGMEKGFLPLPFDDVTGATSVEVAATSVVVAAGAVVWISTADVETSAVVVSSDFVGSASSVLVSADASVFWFAVSFGEEVAAEEAEDVSSPLAAAGEVATGSPAFFPGPSAVEGSEEEASGVVEEASEAGNI